MIELEMDVLPQSFVVFFDHFQPGHDELCAYTIAKKGQCFLRELPV
jgi:hypothetical protein